MSTSFFDRFHTPQAVLAADQEELAWGLLASFGSERSLHRNNFLGDVSSHFAIQQDSPAAEAILTAWSHLVHRGYLIERGAPGEFFVSAAGIAAQRQILENAAQFNTERRVIGDRWKVVKRLGAGGQGDASLVEDIHDEGRNRFVLKELRSGDEKARRRFENEQSALKELEHPNILRLVACDMSADPPYYVSEYCEGRGLDQADLDSFVPAKRLELFLDVCAALAAAHHKGISHRDLKPANVLLKSSEGPAILGDFGLCYFADAQDRLTTTHEDIGSSFCRAPELFDGPSEADGKRADVYCLGKLLYWLMAGSGGREGRLNREEFRNKNKDLVAIHGDQLYEHINSLLSAMVHEDPGKRLADAGEVLARARVSSRLFSKGYHPIKSAPDSCTWCGVGKYVEHPNRGAMQPWWRDYLNTFAVFTCDQCGHTLSFFLKRQ
jgi:serine/threonine protein kinase